VQSCGLPDGPIVRFTAQGKELSRVAARASASVDGKAIIVPWYQVQQSLLEFLPPNTLELGCALENVDVTPDGVMLGFCDKPDFRAKVVIGCDGNQSVLRQAILGDGAPEFVGTAIWRGQTPIPANWPHLDNHASWFVDMPNGTTAQVVRLTDGYMAWMVVGGWDPARVAELGSGRYIDAASTSPAAGTKLDRCLTRLGPQWSSYVLVRSWAGLGRRLSDGQVELLLAQLAGGGVAGLVAGRRGYD
jgi:2-polyprenyl-6-methoxyphenol hydroxylase-like FAD-dependent oxidoreductase